MKRLVIVIISMIMVLMGAHAQSDRDLIRQGNHLYALHKYTEAEVAYRKAIALNPNNPRAIYNLGCALQKEKRDSDAIKQYTQSVKIEPNQNVRAQGYFNMGVAYQSLKDYAKAIEAYKNCLRLKPDDNDARYNYVLCKHMLKNQQNNGGGNKNDKNKDKDKNDKNKQDKQNQQNKDKQQNKDQQKNQQPQNGEISKENAEQMLQAAMNEEKATEAKLKKAMQQPSSSSHEQNW